VSLNFGKQVGQCVDCVQNNNMNKSQHIKAQFPDFVRETPLEFNKKLSEQFGANIFLKREDLQSVRSYKIRGAFARMSQLSNEEKNKGVICASAGNHAQGLALCCKEMQVKGTIVMPETTPKQKINMVKSFGEEWVSILLVGDTFDAAKHVAEKKSITEGLCFIPPFDDEWVIAGQGTVGIEIISQLGATPDFILVPVGGGGLAAGICSVFSEISLETKIIGVEPTGAPSMTEAMRNGAPIELYHIDKFVDGASVKRVGDLNFEICQDKLSQMLLVDEGKICGTILQLYNEFGIVVEPAGALTVAALEQLNPQEIKDKTIVLILSGGNNDITRTEEIRERWMLYEGLKHYFLIRFPQRPGALKEFVSDVMGPTDDIVYFQFSSKTGRESGPAVVGIETALSEDRISIENKLREKGFDFEYLQPNSLLFQQLVG
jgi:threonine dehydratase